MKVLVVYDMIYLLTAIG